jgi:lipopolysaccharide assembly outer membrane protein LptD (OstA)
MRAGLTVAVLGLLFLAVFPTAASGQLGESPSPPTETAQGPALPAVPPKKLAQQASPAVIDAQPAAESKPPAAQPAPKAEPETATPQASGQKQPARGESPVQKKKKETPPTGVGQYRHMPLILPEARAPQPGHRPTPSPEVAFSRKRFSEPFDTGVAFHPEETLQPPDWTQPLRDIEADLWESQLDKDEILLKGNVRLRLDTMNFAADEFWYSKPTGEMRATGNVRITQGTSHTTADEVYYKVPDLSALPTPTLLKPSRSEQERAKLRLSSGTMDATNIIIEQPDQELVASHLKYNLADASGELEDAKGQAGIYYFGAERLRILGPAGADGENVWVTTCDQDPPHYKVLMNKAMIRDGKAVYGESGRLQLGDMKTPLYWPRWGYEPGQTGALAGIDFHSGHSARIGYFVNTGQQVALSPEAKLGVRFFPTSREGVGFGLDAEYDFTKDPASPLFLAKGTVHSLYTTHDRGYLEVYHRQEIFDDTILLVQSEERTDKDFYRDFFYEKYRNRSTPRSFVNVTYTKPTYIATATVRPDTQGFVHETERMPEVSYHLLQRPIAENLYFSFDTVDGYLERQPQGPHAVRLINIGRLTYDINVHEALNITPFLELEASGYSKERNADDLDARWAGTIGTTVQTRLYRAYSGWAGFSGFKHIVVPSITYSYRPEPTMGVSETPFFDAYDNANGRSRVETKIDNVLLGRDGQTQDVWQVARLSLYQGNDLWNEVRKIEDYEAELDLRPRPWWGWLLAGERYKTDELALEESSPLQTTFFDLYRRAAGNALDEERYYPYGEPYGDYNRVLTYFYYDDTYFQGDFNARVGFSYTETMNVVSNREILYGLGYKLGEHWSVGFEHWYDIEHNELVRQKYELRRTLHCWEAALMFRERQSGWDIGVEFSIAAFPTTKVKF